MCGWGQIRARTGHAAQGEGFSARYVRKGTGCLVSQSPASAYGEVSCPHQGPQHKHACALPPPDTIPHRGRHRPHEGPGRAQRCSFLPPRLPLCPSNADLGGQTGTPQGSTWGEAPTAASEACWLADRGGCTPRVQPPAAPPTAGASCSSLPPRPLRRLCNSELGGHLSILRSKNSS